ncbi:hypothetical protein A2311_05815 [candidate division WOR-1 bacterium RIFOXYB2_FULL_48_7]|uniref:Uncharacterized protein n=1 Tax=candidate division WOR-1 bacterium RIFOXYB2_FULL_48_7 TaxID=1802583 RepID=A0A1F4TWA8_UNCSA|nr:MAG: hypothetical protein A2311_05815 [candidate division WOR-1 bacterium RIFOXYB2_FULL_48_7]
MAKNIGFSSQALPQLFQYKGEGVWGVTGVIKDDQAHLSIHTFPDQGKFFLGVYAASEIAEQDVLQQLMAAFNPAKHQVTHFDQGEELDQIVAAESGLVERPRIYH